ncbi:Fructose-2,6-bisphosphatase [Candidatus Sulfopaludibacter sp. SbA6]|nr:Fructose-2,6-bisphosphatase [Candidatus Sulfopaludibacter sp. SbA6]
MSTLTLVRHGQAQPFQREGAVLSSLGEAQAAMLAQWWLAKRVSFDHVYTGALVRQTQTEQVVAKCFRDAGQPWPAARHDASWNEYDAPGVLARMVPADPRLAALAAEFEQARGGPDEKRRFQRMFEAAMSCWIEGSLDQEGVELWPAFRDRVSAAIGRILAGPASRRVVVFTSGGPIGVSVQFTLKAPARSFLDIHWRVRNTSVTEFVFDRERLTLDSFNGIPHLDDLGLLTYR